MIIRKGCYEFSNASAYICAYCVVGKATRLRVVYIHLYVLRSR
jgi:hypothetical protein